MSTSLTAPNLLFYITRSLNKNVVIYSYNKSDKKLDENNPINSYWIMREKDGNPTEELTFFEKKMAFGLKIVNIENNECYFTVSALPNETLQLKLTNKGKFRCHYIYNQKEYILKKVHVDTNEGLMVPTVNFIELYLQDKQTNEIIKVVKYSEE